MIPVYAQEAGQNSAYIPTDLYDSMELLNNPDLEETVEFGISGDSGEFSYSQNQDGGMVTLNWTHVADTELEYNLSKAPPNDMEFVYFSQGFTWDYDETPIALNLSLIYNITTTEDFHFYPVVGFYEIGIWFVHPNGDWLQINNFYGGEDQLFYQWNIIGDWALEDIFQGLLEAEGNATSKLVVGLVPSIQFVLEGSTRWRVYTGSVLISFKEVSMNVIYRTANDLPTPEEPLYEISWKQGDRDEYLSSCITPEGYTYILSTYDYSDGISLTKLDPQAEVVWRKTWNSTNTVFWDDIAYHNDIVYLVGPSEDQGGGTNIMVTALDRNGNHRWSKVFDYDFFDSPRGIEISDDGEIYIGCSSYDTGDHQSDHLIKLNLEGLHIWEREFGLYDWDEIIDLGISREGHIYTQTYDQIIQWNKYGERQWDIEDYIEEMFVLSDGSVLAIKSPYYYYPRHLNLTKYTSEGEIEWFQMLPLRNTEDWIDYLEIRSMTQGSDGIIYLLLAFDGFYPGQLIMRLNQDGTQLENYTVSISEDLRTLVDVPEYMDIHASSNNFVYLCGEFIHERIWWSSNASIIISILDMEPLFLDSFGGTLLATGIATAAIIGTIVAWTLWPKKK